MAFTVQNQKIQITIKPGAPGGITVEDDGSTVSSLIRKLNFTSGLAAQLSGDTVDVSNEVESVSVEKLGTSVVDPITVLNMGSTFEVQDAGSGQADVISKRYFHRQKEIEITNASSFNDFGSNNLLGIDADLDDGEEAIIYRADNQDTIRLSTGYNDTNPTPVTVTFANNIGSPVLMELGSDTLLGPNSASFPFSIPAGATLTGRRDANNAWYFYIDENPWLSEITTTLIEESINGFTNTGFMQGAHGGLIMYDGDTDQNAAFIEPEDGSVYSTWGIPFPVNNERDAAVYQNYHFLCEPGQDNFYRIELTGGIVDVQSMNMNEFVTVDDFQEYSIFVDENGVAFVLVSDSQGEGALYKYDTSQFTGGASAVSWDDAVAIGSNITVVSGIVTTPNYVYVSYTDSSGDRIVKYDKSLNVVEDILAPATIRAMVAFRDDRYIFGSESQGRCYLYTGDLQLVSDLQHSGLADVPLRGADYWFGMFYQKNLNLWSPHSQDSVPVDVDAQWWAYARGSIYISTDGDLYQMDVPNEYLQADPTENLKIPLGQW